MPKASTKQTKRAAAASGSKDAECFVYMLGTSDKNGARTSGLFTTPDSLGPGVKVVGPR